MRNATSLLFILLLHTLSTAQLLPPGSLDPTFDPGTGFEYVPGSMEPGAMRVNPMPDGTLLVGGEITSYNGQSRPGIIKLGADGTPVEAFNANNTVAGIVEDIAVDGNTGKIVLGGITELAPGVPSGGMAVLLPDGSVDPDFNAGSGFTGNNLRVTAVAVQGDKYIVGGRFYQYQGVTRRFLTRLNADGSVDNSFPQPFNNYLAGEIRKIIVLPNGDFVAIGSLGFDSFEVDARLWYFNADGTINAAMTGIMGQITGGLRDIHRLDDGKFLILGLITNYGGQGMSTWMIRINPDGSLDNTFSSGITGLDPGGFNPNWVERMAVQADGKIVVTGFFPQVSGTTYNSIVRLLPNGAIDPEWDPGAGCNAPSTDVAMSNDQRIYVVGRFWQYDSVARSGIVRIHSVPTSTTGIAEFVESGLELWPNPARGQLFVQAPSEVQALQVLDASGRIVLEQRVSSSSSVVLDVTDLRPGSYLLRTWQGTRIRISRFMVM